MNDIVGDTDKLACTNHRYDAVPCDGVQEEADCNSPRPWKALPDPKKGSRP